MRYDVNFGRLDGPRRTATPGPKFRLALLGDFSGRANAGLLETGEALARRKPIRIDVDTLDDVIARLSISLSLALDDADGIVSVPIGSIDDFHPDQIVENVALFAQLRELRRALGTRAGFDRAAKQVRAWGGETALPAIARKKSAAVAVPTDRERISDFARLTGRRPGTAEAADDAVAALLRRIVGPLIQPAQDARADHLIARVDEALSAAMRRVLRHPDFQAAEALWRGVDFLVRRIETGARLDIVLYDVSAEELAADLAATDRLDATGLFGMLVEQPALDASQGALSALLGFYGFDLNPVHAELLGRLAQVAGAAGAPFIAGIGPDPLLTAPVHEQHPMIRAAWEALRAHPAAAWLGLAAPRFLLRMPYGRKSDPIDAFALEEFSRQSGLSGMLWGHPALIPGLLLAQTFSRQGAKMKPGALSSVGEMAYYVFTDSDGEQIALPCTERLLGERQAARMGTYGVMPLFSPRGRPEIRLGGFLSLAGGPLAGFWAPAAPTVTPPPPPPVAPAPVSPVAAAPVAAEPVAVPEETAPEQDTASLDAVLASLSTETPPPPEPAAAAPEAAASAAEDDLDALLASLNAEPPPSAPDATEADLDALLASLR